MYTGTLYTAYRGFYLFYLISHHEVLNKQVLIFSAIKLTDGLCIISYFTISLEEGLADIMIFILQMKKLNQGIMSDLPTVTLTEGQHKDLESFFFLIC